MPTNMTKIRSVWLNADKFNILKILIASKIYKIGHTIPKTNPGGIKSGLFRDLYQCELTSVELNKTGMKTKALAIKPETMGSIIYIYTIAFIK